MEKNSGNNIYYLCLINWHRILTDKEMDEFKEAIERLDKSPRITESTSEDWTKIKLEWENDDNLNDILSESTLGFYHSRLIFWLKLKNAPKTITKIRRIRIKLEDKIKEFCQNEIIKEIEKINKETKGPLIFIYPIFELNREEQFWTIERKRPFSLPTTCFFTKLDDIESNYVEMRISGAKIISMDMSDWFFEILVNIVFHEGLYRQTRDKKLKIRHLKEDIYGGLENRLEDFASKLMTIFHQYSTTYSGREIQETSLQISKRSLKIAQYSALFAIISVILVIISVILAIIRFFI